MVGGVLVAAAAEPPCGCGGRRLTGGRLRFPFPPPPLVVVVVVVAAVVAVPVLAAPVPPVPAVLAVLVVEFPPVPVECPPVPVDMDPPPVPPAPLSSSSPSTPAPADDAAEGRSGATGSGARGASADGSAPVLSVETGCSALFAAGAVSSDFFFSFRFFAAAGRGGANTDLGGALAASNDGPWIRRAVDHRGGAPGVSVAAQISAFPILVVVPSMARRNLECPTIATVRKGVLSRNAVTAAARSRSRVDAPPHDDADSAHSSGRFSRSARSDTKRGRGTEEGEAVDSSSPKSTRAVSSARARGECSTASNRGRRVRAAGRTACSCARPCGVSGESKPTRHA